MGRAVESLGGRYVVADDIGTTLEDLAVMREVTRHTAAATAAAGQRGHRLRRADGDPRGGPPPVGEERLAGLRVAVQGLGNVGRPLAGYLAEAGAS